MVLEAYAATVTYQAYSLALAILVLSQVIYLNLHYLIGVVVTCIVCLFIVVHVIINARELHALDKSDYHEFSRLYRAHQWIVHALMLTLVPFLIWVVVLMAQNHATSGL